jgi:hypothetical protein
VCGVVVHNWADHSGKKHFSESWADTCSETPERKVKLISFRGKEKEQMLLVWEVRIFQRRMS